VHAIKTTFDKFMFDFKYLKAIKLLLQRSLIVLYSLVMKYSFLFDLRIGNFGSLNSQPSCDSW